jgi:hypothetical protein
MQILLFHSIRLTIPRNSKENKKERNVERFRRVSFNQLGCCWLSFLTQTVSSGENKKEK